MVKLPFDVNPQGRGAVVTGSDGVLCGKFAEALALAGAKKDLLNRIYRKGENCC